MNPTHSLRGVSALPMILLIGGIVIEFAVSIAFLVFLVNNTNFGARLSAEALAAARSGIDDGIRRVIRNTSYNTTYDLTVGSRAVTVVVAANTPTTNKTQITATGSAGTRQRQLVAVLQIDATTGEVVIESISEQSL